MSKLIDLTGQAFGDWKVLERAENNNAGKAMWLCLCTKCNETIKAVQGTHLRSGNSTCCTKCRQKKMVAATKIDETGNKYGFLKVIREAKEEEKPRHDRSGVYWVCECQKCGRKNVVVFGDYLRSGETKSCGCLNSYNESKICQMLDENNLKYVQQFRFPDLTSTGRKCDQLMFDICVQDVNGNIQYLIEYDGIQHFEDGHFKGNYKTTHRNDLLKNKYCFDNNIPLIRIPYNANYDLNDLKLDTTRFLLTPENEGEYYATDN